MRLGFVGRAGLRMDFLVGVLLPSWSITGADTTPCCCVMVPCARLMEGVEGVHEAPVNGAISDSDALLCALARLVGFHSCTRVLTSYIYPVI